MKSSIIFSFVTAAAAVQEWVPAGPSDSRSPCPGLNTLANHGYLPRDGKNITIQQFVDAISQGFGYDVSVGQFLATNAFSLFGIDANGTIDLLTLNTPNVLEHNASLTRWDQPGGDSLHVDPVRVDAMLADSPHDYLDVVSAAVSRNRVYAESNYPNLSDTITTVMYGESALALVTMAEDAPVAGASNEEYYAVMGPKSWTSVFFKEERMPVELGWNPLSRKVTIQDIAAFGSIIEAQAKTA